MTKLVKTILAAMSAFATVACSEVTEDTAVEEVAVEEAAQAAMQSEEATNGPKEVFEVCDADGNRYPSEAEAEAAGLDRAEYGATFCDYIE